MPELQHTPTKNILNKRPIFILLLLLAIAFVAYQPGLSGGFMLDDVSVLRHLAIMNGSFSFESFFNFITYTDTGPLKRPISMASFLLDGQNWPVDATSFKRTNVLLHLLNGLLLFVLLYQVINKHPQWKKHSLLIVAVSTACWVLNPFWVSTTLYVVQRMAMLSAFFILLGLNVYVSLRLRFSSNHDLKTLFIYAFVVYGFTLLAVLSKESGVLMLGMLPLFESLICKRALSLPPLPRVWRAVLLWIPVTLLVVAFVVQIPGFMERYDYRAFTWTERVLSQPRALGQYLLNIIIPQRMTEGVFTDGFVVSTGWFQPFETWFWFLVHALLLTGGILFRNRWPLLCFAVLFFYLGHLIESTIVPLELYFEHRNYLPAVFLFVPLALIFAQLIARKAVIVIVPLLIVLLMTLQLYFKSSIWGDNLLMHHLSMQTYPKSARAVTLTAIKLSQLGRHEEALAVVRTGSEHIDSIALQSNVLLQSCFLKVSEQSEFDDVVVSVANNEFTKDDIQPFEVLFDQLNAGACDLKVSDESMVLLLDGLNNNRAKEKDFVRALYHVLLGKYELFRLNRPDQSVIQFKQALLVGKDVYQSMALVELLAANNDKAEAAQLLKAVASFLEHYSGKNKDVLMERFDVVSKAIEK